MLNVIIHNSGYCNQVSLSINQMFNHTFLYSDAVTKSASFIKEIHRKVKETVTTVPHQGAGYARIPADTNLKQGAVLPLGPQFRHPEILTP